MYILFSMTKTRVQKVEKSVEGQKENNTLEYEVLKECWKMTDKDLNAQ